MGASPHTPGVFFRHDRMLWMILKTIRVVDFDFLETIIRHNLTRLSLGGLLSSIPHVRFTEQLNFSYLLPSVKPSFAYVGVSVYHAPFLTYGHVRYEFLSGCLQACLSVSHNQ